MFVSSGKHLAVLRFDMTAKKTLNRRDIVALLLSPDSSRLYAAQDHATSSFLLQLDTSTDTVTNRWPAPNGQRLGPMAWANGRLWSTATPTGADAPTTLTSFDPLHPGRGWRTTGQTLADRACAMVSPPDSGLVAVSACAANASTLYLFAMSGKYATKIAEAPFAGPADQLSITRDGSRLLVPWSGDDPCCAAFGAAEFAVPNLQQRTVLYSTPEGPSSATYTSDGKYVIVAAGRLWFFHVGGSTRTRGALLAGILPRGHLTVTGDARRCITSERRYVTDSTGTHWVDVVARYPGPEL